MANLDAHFQQIFQCQIQERTIKKYQSYSTGLSITHIDTESPKVRGNITVATEETGNDGLPHILEHLVFHHGSELYPYNGFLNLAANHCLAQSTNTLTTIDHTSYTVETVGSKEFLVVLPIYLDHIFFPTLSDEAFKTEVHHVTGTGDDAGVVYCEMQARENKDWCREQHAIQATVFTNDCGYKWETGGIMKNLRESCSNQKVKEFHEKFYRPENVNIIISGKIDIKEIFNAIIPVNEKIDKVNYGPYIKPWSTDVEMFISSATRYISVPALNGRVSISWKGPLLKDVMMCQAHLCLWSYLTASPVSPLVKALIDIPDPYCSSVVRYFNGYYPTTTMNVCCTGVKPNKHQAIKEIIMKTLQETHESSFDMDILRQQIKKVTHNFLDRRANDPISLASTITRDQLYGDKSDYGDHESHYFLQSFCSMFDMVKELLEKDEYFWRDILQYYMKESNITINSIPSVQCMADLEFAKKQRIVNQQKLLEEGALANASNETNDSIAFNENNIDGVNELIGQIEGTLWKQIGGQEFSYSYGLYNDPCTVGKIFFLIGRATNTSKAYLVAKDTIKNLIDENKLNKAQIDNEQIQVYKIYENHATYFVALSPIVMKGYPPNHTGNLIDVIEHRYQKDLLSACKKRFKLLKYTTTNDSIGCSSNNLQLHGIGLNINAIDHVQLHEEVEFQEELVQVQGEVVLLGQELLLEEEDLALPPQNDYQVSLFSRKVTPVQL